MLFTSVTDEPAGEDGIGQGSLQGSLMRLGASINLESMLTVSILERRTCQSSNRLDRMCRRGVERYQPKTNRRILAGRS